MSMGVRIRRSLSLAALLLATATQVHAEEEQIYKWMDEQGMVHFTSTPPPRNARPIGTRPKSAGPMQVVPMPASPKRSSARPLDPSAPSNPRVGAPRKAAKTDDSGDTDCRPHRDVMARLNKAEREVENLRASIEQMKDDPVSSSRTSCSTEAERQGRCVSSYYNREKQLDSTRNKLERAEDELADVEGEARAAGVPTECLNESR